MKKTCSILFILWMAVGSACAVIAGKEDEAGQQKPSVNLLFVESLRSGKSLRGESWNEPQYGTSPATSLQQPNSVYADAFRVYVTDTYTSTAVISPRVFVFDRGERMAAVLNIHAPPKSLDPGEGSLIAPSAIAVDPTNVIFVADSLKGRVFGYDLNGTLMRVFGRSGELGKPTGLAVDHARVRLYVADAADHKVKAFNTLGTTFQGDILLTVGGSGKTGEDFKFPAAIALDRAGNLFVLDSQRRRVYVYDPDGRFIRQFSLSDETTGSPLKPRGIAVDSDGHVYVTDMVSNNILLFDKDGVFIQTWGRAGGLIGDFLSPAGIFIDTRDTVYVADQMNGRVQVFQYSK